MKQNIRYRRVKKYLSDSLNISFFFFQMLVSSIWAIELKPKPEKARVNVS